MNASRYWRILIFFVPLLIKFGFWDILLPWLGLRQLSINTRPRRFSKAARDFKNLAVDMGGVMIKVGQFLSARLDVLPSQVTDELAGLQDEVRPESYEDIRQVIENEFNQPLESLFLDFQTKPLASASIGQVHRARVTTVNELNPGQEMILPVVVKVQRPGIQDIIETDLAALEVVTGWLSRYPPIRKHVNLKALLREFNLTIHQEMDYLNEGKNAETFQKNFKGHREVLVPKVYWQYTTVRVLTLEDVLAIKITDYQAIEEAGIDRAEVANILLDTYLKQVFEDQFFHADPHPGNLFVLPEPSMQAGPGGALPRWQLVFVDFGMAGTVPDNIYQGLREMLVALGTRDAARLVKSYQLLGVLLPSADLELLERAEEHLLERFWGKSVPDIMKIRHDEIREFMKEFRQLIYDMPFQIPENMILLGRSLAILSGICTGLNPEFNIWPRIAPYAQKLIEADSGWEFWYKEFSQTVGTLLALPKRTDAIYQRIEQGSLVVKNPELNQQMKRLTQAVRQLTAGLFMAMFFLSAVQLFLAGFSLWSYLLFIAAGVSLLWVIFVR